MFSDIAKAFDTVDHVILLEKMYRVGIRGNTYEWFVSYLTMRKQFVKIGTEKSNLGTVISGVPQGSILGSILFLIYINDLCDFEIGGSVFTYVDDTAVVFAEDSMVGLIKRTERGLGKICNGLGQIN